MPVTSCLLLLVVTRTKKMSISALAIFLCLVLAVNAALPDERDGRKVTPLKSRSASHIAPYHPASPYVESRIRCKVCHTAIAHVWHTAMELSQHCRDTVSSDPRCDYHHLHRYGVVEMTKDVCDVLPTKYQSIHIERNRTGGAALSEDDQTFEDLFEYDLVAHEEAEHDRDVAQHLKAICSRWVHEDHGIEHVGTYVFSNIDSKKPTHIAVPGLQGRFCHQACDFTHKRESRSMRMRTHAVRDEL